MPDFELGPGDYKERKPKGWRWKLPWSHAEDTKLPLVGFLVAIGWMVWVYWNRGELSPEWLYLGASLWAFLAGALFMWAFRD